MNQKAIPLFFEVKVTWFGPTGTLGRVKLYHRDEAGVHYTYLKQSYQWGYKAIENWAEREISKLLDQPLDQFEVRRLDT